MSLLVVNHDLQHALSHHIERLVCHFEVVQTQVGEFKLIGCHTLVVAKLDELVLNLYFVYFRKRQGHCQTEALINDLLQEGPFF